MLNEFIYTPGQVQTATINVGGALKKASTSRRSTSAPTRSATSTLLPFDANNSDDVIFGGLGDDFLHGGSGDDAISGGRGARARTPLRAARQATGAVVGLVRTDWTRPFNPGDLLRFGADDPWLAPKPTASRRAGEFSLYDEYDPRRAILFNADGRSGAARLLEQRPHLHRRRRADRYQFFLNFNVERRGRDGHRGCVATAPTARCCCRRRDGMSDGNDALFGDLGNDWLVGGTGKRHALRRLGQRPPERRRRPRSRTATGSTTRPTRTRATRTARTAAPASTS